MHFKKRGYYMKLIHTADLHLFSPLSENLGIEKAKLRNSEVLGTFGRIADYAKKNAVAAILISGDLFDGKSITKGMADAVFSVIKNAPETSFYYLPGNHDGKIGSYDCPENLKVFGPGFEKAECKDAVIGGLGDGGNASDIDFSSDKTNILMLHGDISNGINLSHFKGKNIDYIALGHIHSFSSGSLDMRTKYAYSGCPEGRGYDECGEKGFVLINAENGRLDYEFIPFAKRKIKEITLDVTGLSETLDVAEKADGLLSQESRGDMINLVLTGKLQPDNTVNTEIIAERYRDRFFDFKVTVKTSLLFDKDEYMYDDTLKGEFIRCVASNEKYTEEEKLKIIETGLKALTGEALI